MSDSSGHRHSVPRQVMVNLFVQAATEVGMPWLESSNNELYKKLGWLAQNRGTELQVAIGGAASAAEILSDALPFLKDDVKGVIDEGLESLGSSTVKYYKGRALGLPEDYKVEGGLGGLVSEFFKGLADAFKASAGKVQQLFWFAFPSHEAKETGAQYQAFALVYPDDVSRLLEFISSLPHDVEDDWQRVSPTLPPSMVKAILVMDHEKAILALRRMAKDTTEEVVQESLSGVGHTINEVLDGVNEGIDKRRAAREARLSNKKPALATARVVDSDEEVIDVTVERLSPEQRSALGRTDPRSGV